MKISIVGMPKTGTTALYEAIKLGMPADTATFFEPKTTSEVDYILSLEKPSLTKFMLNKIDAMTVGFERFDRVVFIVRDPRDFAVSSLLYRFDSAAFAEDVSRLDGLIAQFERKERNPSSISLSELYRSTSPKGEYDWSVVEQMLGRAIEFVANEENVHVLRYEDFVENRLDELSEYLGFEVKNSVKLTGWTSKISRKGVAGDWLNWFTEEDIQLRPYLEAYMTRFGYDLNFDPSSNPVIEPEHCSLYIRRLVAESQASPVSSKSVMSEGYLANLESAARDGKHMAMTKLAVLKLEGAHVEKDIHGAESLLKVAQSMGNVTAMRHYGKLLVDKPDRVDEMRSVLERAVAAGDREACYFLAESLLKESKMLDSDLATRGIALHELGAERGSKSCIRRLAKLYRKRAIEGDESRALAWESRMAELDG